MSLGIYPTLSRLNWIRRKLVRWNRIYEGFPFGENTLDTVYYYVFYSEWTDTMWIMSSEEFVQESSVDRWRYEYSIALNELSESSENGDKIVQNVEKYQKYICTDFSRLHVVES